MYIIIIFYVIGYLLSLYFIYIDNGSIEVEEFIILIFSSLIFALIGLILAVSLSVEYKTTTWHKDLVTVKDNNTTTGSFFLGSGTIGGQMKYVYYIQNNDNTYQMFQTDCYKAKIKYVNTKPQIVITEVSVDETLWNKFALDIVGETGQTYIFEVPQGSIKNNYELDAQ